MRRPVRLAAPLLALLLAAAPFAVPPASAAPRAGAPTRGLRFPSLTPDGKTVVFAWRGDIWRAPVDGGAAARLTIHEAQDTKPRVSPDGTRIAFSSRRNGGYDVFVLPIEGGEPRQVTFHSGSEVVTDWSPDGRRLLYVSGREPSPYGMDLYETDLEGGAARRVTRDGGRDGAYAPDGRTIVYTRGFGSMWEDDYEGSAGYDLYVTDVDGALPRRLTSAPHNETAPCVSADGRTVWFLAPWKKRLNVWSVPLEGGEAAPVTTWTDDDVRRPTLGWDRRTLAFEKGALLWTTDLKAQERTPVSLPVVVESDVRNSGTEPRTLTDGAEHVAVSPDGTRLAVAVRGDLWVLPAAGGEGTRVTSGPATDDWPRFSPDGTRLAYHSDVRGNEDVHVLDLASKESRAVTSHAKDDAFPAWAPDGRRIVYTSDRTGNKDLWLLDLESGEERQLTRDPKDDDDATFSPDGQWIAFDSGRSGAQAIWVMPVAAGDAQARRVTGGAGFYQVPTFSPDGAMVAYEELDPNRGAGGGIWVSKATGGPAVQVSRDGSAAFWSPRGDWIYFSAERDGSKEIWRVRAPQAIEAGERVPFLGRVTVDRRREFGDLFDEAWRRLKDGFYDPAMHGVDWDAMREKYRPLAVDAEIRDEFHAVVSQMLGELNASHLGISAGAAEDDEPRGPQTGCLGLELAPQTEAGAGRRVAAVAPRGPADEAGLRAGDVLQSVAGKRVEAQTDLDRLLAGAAGRDVPVVFAKADGSGERTVRVRATTWAALRRLAHDQWVERSRRTVKERTEGEAGYIHLDRMDQANLARFVAQLGELAQDRKVKGLVLDVRNNGGGNIHQPLLDALSSRPFIAFQPRGQSRQVQPSPHWGKPVVLLINERSFSDAEVFPYAFKQLRLGKVVGVPTAGGVIGTNDVTLSDGSRFRVPRVGWYGLNGENLERLGVKPDVLVEESPQDRREGRDPQLARAIDVLLEEIRGGASPAPAGKPAPEEPPADKPASAGGGGPGRK